MEKIRRKKKRAALYSVISNSMLIILKFIAGFITGSISIISEAIHSFIDLLAAIIAYISVGYSSHPADRNHPYGHGKIENISGTIEAILIFVAAGYIIYESILKIIKGSKLEVLEYGILVMFISVVVNILVSKYLLKVSRETSSMALEADAAHLTTDVYTSLGVFAGLFVVKLTAYDILDPIIAIGVSLFIIRAAYQITKKSVLDLLDHTLPEEEAEKIRKILSEHQDKFVSYHKFRSRKSGNERYIDLHLVMSNGISLNDAHEFCTHLEKDIENILPGSVVTIHVEPA